MKKDLPIRIWREPIDGTTCAVCAKCVVIQRGSLRGFGIFVILTMDDLRARQWDWRGAGRDRFLELLKNAYHGFLPYICRVDEPAAALFV